MLARVTNGVLQIGVPTVSQLHDGRWVSNYNLLSEEELKTEGWKDVVENRPGTEEVMIESFVESENCITINYITSEVQE